MKSYTNLQNHPEAAAIYDVLTDWAALTRPLPTARYADNHFSMNDPGTGTWNFDVAYRNSILAANVYSRLNHQEKEAGIVIENQPDGYEFELEVSLSPYSDSRSLTTLTCDDLQELGDSRDPNFDRLISIIHDPFCRQLILQLIDQTIIHAPTAQ